MFTCDSINNAQRYQTFFHKVIVYSRTRQIEQKPHAKILQTEINAAVKKEVIKLVAFLVSATKTYDKQLNLKKIQKYR